MSREPRPGDYSQVARSVVQEATRARDADRGDTDEKPRDLDAARKAKEIKKNAEG